MFQRFLEKYTDGSQNECDLQDENGQFLASGSDLESISQSLAFPPRVRNRISNVMTKVKAARWESGCLESRARENAAGLVLAVENRLAKQAELHAQQLDQICGLNSAEKSVRLVSQHGGRAKPFAVCREASQTIQVQGHGYMWQLESIQESDVVIPPQHLAQLSLLSMNGIQPDSLYVAVPYCQSKETLPRAMALEIKGLIEAGANAVGRVRDARLPHRFQNGLNKLADPLLIAGFGDSPVVLVELARWV